MLKRIHVSQQNIKANFQDGGNRPCFTVRVYEDEDTEDSIAVYFAHHVAVNGPSEFVYRIEGEVLKGTKHGRIWVQTTHEVTIQTEDGEKKL